jgi:outer membrane protein
MKSLLSCIALVVTLFPSSSRATPGDSLTVVEAVSLVLARNPAVQEASQGVAAANARVDLSRGGYLPSADIDAGYTLLEPIAQIEFGGIGFKLYPANNFDAHIGIRQPLFDFSRTSSQVDLATTGVDLANDARESLRRDLTFRTIETFCTILLLRKSVEVQDEQIRTLNEHLSTTQKKIATGTATQLDALSTQVRVAAAQTVRINLSTSLQRSEIALRRLMSLPQEATLNLHEQFSYDVISLNDDSLTAIALRDRIEEKASQHAIAWAEAQIRVARFSDNPSLKVYAVYGVKNGLMPNLDVLRGNLAAGAELRIPILDGRRATGMEEEAEALLEREHAKERGVDLMIRAEVKQAAAEMRASLEKLGVSRVNIDRADKALENARLRYEAGTVQNIDLLDATTERAQAKLTLLQALYDVVISSYQLRRAVGTTAFGT